MSQVFHDIEKKIIKVLQDNEKLSFEKLGELTKLSDDQVRRGIEWLRLKELANVEEIKKIFLQLGSNGIEAYNNGLPERQLVDLLKSNPQQISKLRQDMGTIFGPAMGQAKRNGWIKTMGDKVMLTSYPEQTVEEDIISKIGNQGKISEDEIEKKDTLLSLKKRPDFFVEDVKKTKIVSLNEEGKKVVVDATSGAIDVEAEAPRVFAARTNPLNDVIGEIREAFVALGFTEVVGKMTQPSFWNFDALFTPQDHPAREMQDTFYLEGNTAKKFATSNQIKQVSQSHKKNWRYYWDIQEARRMVLRTHTTCVTIKYLADNKPDDARIFSLGRVFRNEKVSYKHLVEFNQVEGVVVGRNTTLRDLMGIQREFYRRIGLPKIKFWPTFFPYTEPSLQTMVYNERLNKWVELFGMGIFRPEVTRPLGISKQVLAWGGGIERIAMLKYGIDDVREFYNNNLGWLRSVPKCQL